MRYFFDGVAGLLLLIVSSAVSVVFMDTRFERSSIGDENRFGRPLVLYEKQKHPGYDACRMYAW